MMYMYLAVVAWCVAPRNGWRETIAISDMNISVLLWNTITEKISSTPKNVNTNK